jgi:hypothetical protein
MSNIFDKLNSIKGKLANLEVSFEAEVKKEEKSVDYKQRLEQKLPKLIKNQYKKVLFDIGNEVTIITSSETIYDFPYKLILKSIISNTNESIPIFIDSSLVLFNPIISMIRHLSTEPLLRKKMIINCPLEALIVHSKEYFLDDSDKVLDNFEFEYIPPWEKREKPCKSKKNPNKWNINDYIQCYSCGQQNDGTFWKKRCSYDRANDSYCIDFYIATCLTCDPENTLTY